MENPKRNNLYLSDIVTGVFSSLALRDITRISAEHNLIDQSFEGLSALIEEEAKRNQLNVRFRIKTHPIHGDSPELQNELLCAMQRQLMTYESPKTFRIKISPEEARGYLENVPGDKQMYERLSRELMR